MKSNSKAITYALLAIMFWSTVATAFKIALGFVDFMQLLMFSSFVASIATLIILFIQKKVFLLKMQSFKDTVKSAILGLLNPFFYYLVLLKAYSVLPAQEAMTLNYTWPLMLVLLSAPLLGQKLTLKSMISLIISFTGIIIIATHGDLISFRFSNLKGDFLALGSSVIWAIFWIFNIRDKRDETVKLFMSFSFGFLYSIIIVILFSNLSFLSLEAILAVTYIGLFEMGITFVLWLLALKYADRTDRVSQLIFLSPFLSLFFISLILNEKILPSTLIGLVLIILGILSQQLKFKNNQFLRI